MEYPQYFSYVEILALFIFYLGIWANLAFWLKGGLSRTKEGTGREKLVYLFNTPFRTIFRRDFLKLLSLDILFQRTLTKEDPTRWPMHFPLFLGFCVLYFVGSVGDQLAHWGWVELDKDTKWFAFTNDLAGLILLVGLLLALHRRYVLKLPYLKTFFEDKVLVLLLLVSLVSGYVVEGLRLLSIHSIPESRASFIGVAFAEALSRGVLLYAPTDLDWVATHLYVWWFHALVSLTFFCYIPYSRLFHLFGTSLTLLLNSQNHKADFVGADPTGMVPSFSIKQLIELSGCTRCGECLRVCETYKDREVDPIAPAIKLKEARSHLLHKYGPNWASKLLGGRNFSQQDLSTLSEATFRCTLCGYCTHVCPSKIDLQSIWYSLRQEYATGVGLHPKGFKHLKEGVANEGNIFNYPNVDRALWVDFVENLPTEGIKKDKAKVMYFVGCVSSFSPLAQDIPHAFASLLIKAGVDLTILGPEECCCGFPLMAAGMKDQMLGLIEHNTKKVKALGADTIIFNCPSCYMTWRQEYSPFLPGVSMKHSTEFLLELIRDGKLYPGSLKGDTIKVTYHDPCDLGRNQGVYDAPREVLHSLPGLEFRESRNRKARAICCGGGGVLESADPKMAADISYKTYNSFCETGAEALVVACPQCKRMFQGARKYLHGTMEVMDITELLLRCLQASSKVNQPMAGPRN
ncbi:MAG TPA: (Fe-S)-binding protein [Candidatus Hypogeohydataceae bacterium YC41]